jgi:hypothetical protein
MFCNLKILGNERKERKGRETHGMVNKGEGEGEGGKKGMRALLLKFIFGV